MRAAPRVPELESFRIVHGLVEVFNPEYFDVSFNTHCLPLPVVAWRQSGSKFALDPCWGGFSLSLLDCIAL